jgi:AraC-like DNA-binding protein
MSKITFNLLNKSDGAMVSGKFLEDMIQFLHFEFVRSGIGVIEDSAWRRSGFSRPYNIVFIMERGSLAFTLNHGEKTIVMREGDCAYIPAGMWRQNVPVPKDSKAVLRYCNFYFYTMGNLDFLGFFNIPTILDKASSKKIINITEKLDKINNCSETTPLIKAIENQSAGMDLLSFLLRVGRGKANFSEFSERANRLSKTFEYISLNSHKKINLKELASISCLSMSAFHKMFKEVAGVPPLRYLREQKINKARNLLLSSDLSLSEIAEQLGFSDSFSFSKSFKKICGQSPRDYRQTARREFSEI